jgi:hypothetical protein
VQKLLDKEFLDQVIAPEHLRQQQALHVFIHHDVAEIHLPAGLGEGAQPVPTVPPEVENLLAEHVAHPAIALAEGVHLTFAKTLDYAGDIFAIGERRGIANREARL